MILVESDSDSLSAELTLLTMLRLRDDFHPRLFRGNFVPGPRQEPTGLLIGHQTALFRFVYLSLGDLVSWPARKTFQWPKSVCFLQEKLAAMAGLQICPPFARWMVESGDACPQERHLSLLSLSRVCFMFDSGTKSRKCATL